MLQQSRLSWDEDAIQGKLPYIEISQVLTIYDRTGVLKSLLVQ